MLNNKKSKESDFACFIRRSFSSSTGKVVLISFEEEIDIFSSSKSA